MSAKRPGIAVGLFVAMLFLPCRLCAAVYSQGFEAGWEGWTLWQTHGYATWSIQAPPQAHGGTNVAYSGILNSYREQAITSPVLTAGSSSVQMDFYHLFASGGGDFGWLQISVNGGGMQTVRQYTQIVPPGIVWVVNGSPQTLTSQLISIEQYQHETVDLSPFLSIGAEFTVRFHTAADYNYSSPGWAVDDIWITGVVPEPTTALSLVLGGLVVAGCRRVRTNRQ